MDANIDLIMVDSLKKADELISQIERLSNDLQGIEDHLETIADNTGRIARAMEVIIRDSVKEGAPFLV
jgi:cytochrome c-type biogenesis protein CcmH/NrfF